MARKSPQDIQEKWSRNLKGAATDIAKGVDRVTEAPGVKAAAKVNKMQARLNAAIDDGTWADNVAAVPLSEWKNSMKTKGIPRINAGVDGAAGKVVEFHSQLADHQDRIDAELDGMPDVTLEDSITRATTQIRRMAEFKLRK